MVDTTGSYWSLDNLMMSCRVIGRKIETALIYKIMNDAFRSGAKKLMGEYIPTKKNKLVKHFYADHQFEKIQDKDVGSSNWEIVLEEELKYPEFIEVIEDE